MQVELENATIEPLSKEAIGKDYAFEVCTQARRLLCHASSAAERNAWLKVLRAQSRRHTGNESAGDVAEAKFDSLPSVVAIAGNLEAGSEVKVFAKPPDLSPLTISWFTTDNAAVNDANVAHAVPAEQFIAGANLQTYVLKPADVGRYVGCTIKDKPGSGNKAVRVALSTKTVRPLDVTTVSCRISLRLHQHNKYCDRKERVRSELLRSCARGARWLCRHCRSRCVAAPSTGVCSDWQVPGGRGVGCSGAWPEGPHEEVPLPVVSQPGGARADHAKAGGPPVACRVEGRLVHRHRRRCQRRRRVGWLVR